MEAVIVIGLILFVVCLLLKKAGKQNDGKVRVRYDVGYEHVPIPEDKPYDWVNHNAREEACRPRK